MAEGIQPVSYAGFWRRFAAHLIDSILISVVEFVIFIPALALVGIGVFTTAMEADPESLVGLVMIAVGAYFVTILLSIILGWLYYALMESSARGATVGKLVLGIRVTDPSGGRISFGRATVRYFSKIISAMILMIGYIMAAFTDRKQALHDIIAGTLVVVD
jgi:uncharacterized RDD family membrane protein YckC